MYKVNINSKQIDEKTGIYTKNQQLSTVNRTFPLKGLEDCMHGDSRWRHVGDYHSDFCASLKEGYMGKACAFKTVSNRCCATCKEIMKKR